MNRRTLLLAPLLIPALTPAAQAQTQPAALTAQDRADIARVESYLNGVHTLHARFRQTAPNGGTSEGQVWLERPGRLRFEYDPPSPFLLVGGHGLLVFHDSQLQQTSNIPLGSTPLGVLLQDNLKLSGDVTVSGVARFPGQLQIRLFRTKSPADGTLTLIFSDPPLALRQWEVVDAQRQETWIMLYNVELGGVFSQKLFEFIDPKFFQNNGGRG